ncbi:MAG: hypothetical protein E7214_15870 [Clostridium sp.]|nr:hypothetical protein [Clostridium sp.]
MFGYITPVTDELKVKDFEVFRSYYCGLCFAIKDKFGNLPRYSLNYDVTFFTVILDSLSIEETIISEKTCIKHPYNKKTYVVYNSALDYAADLNLALVYYKVKDDVLDESNIKSSFLLKILTPYYKRLTHKNLDSIISNSLEELHMLEMKKESISIDEISHPFSHIMGSIFKLCPFEIINDSPKIRDTLYNFGYIFGKWIYLIDALDDLKKDMENSRYNPIDQVYNKRKLPYKNFINTIKENMDFTLMSLAVNCSDILKELPINKNKEIIDNVINLGLLNKYMHISLKL